MAGLPNPPGFGSHRWGEVSWANHHSTVNPRFLVKDSASWLPSISTSSARTVNIAAGSGQACGVYDTTDAPESLTFAANTGSGDRYDFFVARFDWATRTRVFTVIQGTTGLPAMNRTGSVVVAGQVNWVPGVRYDGILGWARIRPNATLFQPGDIVDLRVWGGGAGPLVTNTVSNISLLDVPPYGEVISTFNGNVFRRNNEALNYTNVTTTGAVQIQPLPLASGWTAPAPGWSPPILWKDSNGIVYIAGGVVNTNPYTSSGRIADLLAGFRSTGWVDFTVQLNRSDIRLNGNISSGGAVGVARVAQTIEANTYHGLNVFFRAA